MFTYFKDLKQEFHGYNAKTFSQDFLAAITVAAVALPLALAFGVGSGASAASGLITAIVAGFAISLFGGAFFQISGPTGAMAAVLMSIVANYGLQGVFVATFMAGIFLIIAGVLHFGKTISYISMPVITGFTSGISIIIILGQFDNFFGTVSTGTSVLGHIKSYFTNGFDIEFSSTIIGVCTVIFMLLYPKKWQNYCPASLLSIVLATACVIIFGIEAKTVGEIPTNVFLDERFSLFSIDFSHIVSLLAPAVTIALLSMVESLLCGASASKMAGAKLKCDRELIAQGIGNILVPFFGAIPATAAIARTSVAIKSGAKTRLCGMLHAVVLLLAMLLFAPIMSQIPLASLAGVLFVTAFRMNDWAIIRYFFIKRFKGAIAKYLATMIATIIFDLTTAILIGVIISLILLVVELSHLKIRFDIFDSKKLNYQKVALPAGISQFEVVYIMGAIIFANTEEILELVERVDKNTAVIFSMRGTSYLDISGASAFASVIKEFQSKGVPVFIAGMSPDVMNMARRSGIAALIGEENFYWSVEEIIK